MPAGSCPFAGSSPFAGLGVGLSDPVDVPVGPGPIPVGGAVGCDAFCCDCDGCAPFAVSVLVSPGLNIAAKMFLSCVCCGSAAPPLPLLLARLAADTPNPVSPGADNA